MKPKTIRKHLKQIIDDLSANPMLFLRDPRRDFTRTRKLYKDRNHFRYIPSTSAFDFLPSKSRKCDPPHFFDLSFRVVRFKISDSAFETVVTDLPYPPHELKALYAMRWDIETSFRSLKYTVGLSSFHSKKADHILQEIFVSLHIQLRLGSHPLRDCSA